MQRVLKGVAVATKAPECLVQRMSDLIIQRDPTSRYESGPGPESHTTDPPTTGPSFRDWSNVFETTHKHHFEGTITPLIQTILGVALLREKLHHGTSASPIELNTIWTLIHDAIITSSTDSGIKFNVSRSAQGCLVVTLCSLVTNGKIEELWRLHIWLPDGKRGVDAVSVHSHQCFGRSWILAGFGTDVIWDSFDVASSDSSNATHAKYALAWTAAGETSTRAKFMTHQQSSTIRNTGKLVKLQLKGRTMHSRDMSYSIPCNTFHESIVPGGLLHATFFVFDSSRGYAADAPVLGPKEGTEFTQVRETPGITAAKLAEIVESARIVEAGNRSETSTSDLNSQT
ncbi:hypothetical protein OPT61_g775 [Boeremia exigua]|uniref:Uncharacterized protein n=1 Tax=Boeremia exigua TaxID=749465 RepID=A0ACC2ISY7_9PLEO|nr:hypothetical protein OPT61_g775 [Boeremia exigua]